MTTPKGWPCSEKLARTGNDFVTVAPVGPKTHALDVAARVSAFLVQSSAAVGANSTTSTIECVGHSAQRGDIIRITSGALSPRDVSVWSTTATQIILAEDLLSAPALGVTFDILRPARAGAPLTGSGSTTTGIAFQRNGVTTLVTEDTGTPANNRPLPVRIEDLTGPINITAGDIDVHLTHNGANPDSVQIGDGTDLLAINADGSINTVVGQYGAGNVTATTVRTTPAADSPHLLATRHEASATPLATRIGNGTNFADFGAGTVAATTLRTTPASDSPHLLATRHEAVATPLSVRLGNATAFIGTKTLTGIGTIDASVAITTASGSYAYESSSGNWLPINMASGSVKTALYDSSGNTLDLNSGAAGAQTLRTVLATRHEAATTPVAVRITDGSAFQTVGGRTKSNAPVRNDYTSTSVTTAAYTQLVASTTAATNRLHIFDSSGQTLVLATGGAGAEVDQFIIPPGGIDIDFAIAASTRVSIKALSATANSGEIDISFLA